MINNVVIKFQNNCRFKCQDNGRLEFQMKTNIRHNMMPPTNVSACAMSCAYCNAHDVDDDDDGPRGPLHRAGALWYGLGGSYAFRERYGMA